jgi:hypothetical protein
MALHYELRSATEDQSSINVLVAGNEFKIPLSSDPESYPEGVWDLDTIFLIFEMLDDIIRVLELAVSFKKRKVYQMRGRNTDSSVDESIRQCRQGLTEKVSLISESFKSICLSWGFSFPVSAHTLLKSVRSISSEQDVAKNLHLFKTAYSGFEAIIAKLQPKMRADGVQRMVS